MRAVSGGFREPQQVTALALSAAQVWLLPALGSFRRAL